MSLQIPNLDDKNFDELMDEARSLIPIYNKEWTNHNPSDPGITLLELFAWLSEMVIYRINQVPEENYRKFLELIGIEYLFSWDKVPGEDDDRILDFLAQNYDVNWVKTANIEKIDEGRIIKIFTESNCILLELNDEENKATMTFAAGETYMFPVKKENGKNRVYETIENDIRRGLESISQHYRAITSDDFESLAKECMEALHKDLAGRAICVNNRDLEYGNEEKLGHVSVIIIPRCEGYEFSWNEVKGKEKFKLLEFIMQVYNVDWVRTAEIEKNEDGKIVSISNNSNSISLMLNDEKSKVTVNFAGHRPYEFGVEKENEKLNIYGYWTSEGKASDLLKVQVKKYLDKRKLITTRLHVVDPKYHDVKLEARLALKKNSSEKTVDKAIKTVKKYFDPLKGGEKGTGWPLGRNLYPSEIYQLLESIPGVDHVVAVRINDSDINPVKIEDVEIEEYELISLVEPIVIEVDNE